MAKDRYNGLSDLKSRFSGSGSANSKQSLDRQLEEAGQELKQILQKHVNLYYKSYKPKEYIRTFNLMNSIRLSAVEQVGASKYQIRVYFDESAIHPSVLGGEPGNTPWLISEGWDWKNGVDIYRFSHYEGFGFLDSAIEEFRRVNRWGFRIEKRYEGREV